MHIKNITKLFHLMPKYISIIAVICFVLIPSRCYPQNIKPSPVPGGSCQMMLVITDSSAAVKGFLYRFAKNEVSNTWQSIGEKIPVVLGKKGLGWGRGLNNIDISKLPVKKEGDDRSPAGVFTLGFTFGYAKQQEMKDIKMPYVQITEMLECVDDSSSKHYNEILLRDKSDTVDWRSSEKMNHVGIWYDLGIVVNHNVSRRIKGSGSCIFIHNWSEPDETSTGCTEMEPVNLKKIIYWLNSSKEPVLVQLTKQLYDFYKTDWALPDITVKLP